MSSLTVLNMRSSAELVLRAAELVLGDGVPPDDLALLRQLAPSGGSAKEVVRKKSLVPKEDRSLHEWFPEDTDDTASGAEFALSRVIQLEPLTKKKALEELFARPPPKFVHDVAVLVRKETGFLETMSEEWPEAREGRIDILQQIADTVASKMRMKNLQFDPADVLKGKEVPRTLQLLQLLAIAGAKEKNPSNGSEAPASRGEQASSNAAEGSTPAKELPLIFEAMARCTQGAVDQHAKTNNLGSTQGSGNASPTKELESEVRTARERLEEDLRLQTRQQERLASLQNELNDARAKLTEKANELELSLASAGSADQKKLALWQEVERLRGNLLQRAKQASGDKKISEHQSRLEELAASARIKNQEKMELDKAVKETAQERVDVEAQKDAMEHQIKRMKVRLAEGADGEVAEKSQEVMAVQAHQEQLDIRVAELEERTRLLLEADDREKRRYTGLQDQLRDHETKNDDVLVQLQVVSQERDSLREGMDQMWQEKTNVEGELENITNGYTSLSDRLNEKRDEVMELTDKREEWSNLLEVLQRNAETKRLAAAAEPMSSRNVEKAPASPMPPPQPAAPADADGGGDAESGSSHYEDDFEEADDDAD